MSESVESPSIPVPERYQRQWQPIYDLADEIITKYEKSALPLDADVRAILNEISSNDDEESLLLRAMYLASGAAGHKQKHEKYDAIVGAVDKLEPGWPNRDCAFATALTLAIANRIGVESDLYVFMAPYQVRTSGDGNIHFVVAALLDDGNLHEFDAFSKEHRTATASDTVIPAKGITTLEYRPDSEEGYLANFKHNPEAGIFLPQETSSILPAAQAPEMLAGLNRMYEHINKGNTVAALGVTAHLAAKKMWPVVKNTEFYDTETSGYAIVLIGRIFEQILKDVDADTAIEYAEFVKLKHRALAGKAWDEFTEQAHALADTGKAKTRPAKQLQSV